MAQIFLTPAAEADLDAIFDHGQAMWGRQQALTYAEDLLTTIEMIGEFPGLARVRPDFDPPVRLHPHGSHVIVYRETDAQQDGGVTILRILHNRQHIAVYLAD